LSALLSAGLCLALAAQTVAYPPPDSAAQAFVPGQHFTLAWTHSIEKIRWEEDYSVQSHDTKPTLRLDRARVRGSGAGMEPPEDARLVKGWYVYSPTTPLPPALRLTRSPYTSDYTLCANGECQPMSHWLASDGNTTLMWACNRP
jgi:hypothetical protein